jgi:hypothetical protein
MAPMGDKVNIVTPKARASYAYVFRTQKPMNPQQEAKYSLVLLFEAGADLSALKMAAHAAVIEKWGPDKEKWPKNLRSPFRDQGEKEGTDGYVKGSIFITATSKLRPGVVDAKVQDILEEKDFYSGCYCRASVRPFAYDNAGNRGVAFGLQHVQKLADGEPLGGRTRPSDDFEPVNAPAAGATGGIFD